MEAAEARELAWAGCIPAVFSLAQDEVTTLEPPPCYHANLPRQSWLPLVTGEVVEHFLPFAPPMARASSMWMQCRGEPLRWQVPVGVLFDLLTSGDNQPGNGDMLPWQLTVRFQARPTDQLRGSVDDAKALVRSALKESAFLRCGSAQPVMDLSPLDDARIFEALGSASPNEAGSPAPAPSSGWSPPPLPPPPCLPPASPVSSQAAAGQAASQQTPAGKQGQPSASDAPASSPYEVYCQARTPLEASLLRSLGSRSERAVPTRAFVAQREWRQLPVAPLLPSGDPTTLADALALLLPRAFAAASDAEGSGGEGQRPTAIVQGVVVELNTPVSWLYEACSHPDGFLYVVCLMPRS